MGQAPIHKLPTELLVEIFKLNNRRSRLAAGNGRWQAHSYQLLRWNSTTQPFNLLQVCSSWRAIVQSTPSMWNTITAMQWDPCRPDVPELDHWLKNSGAVPLRLHLEAIDDPKHDRRYQHSLLDLYATHSHRWESMAIEMSPSITPRFSSILQNSKDVHGFPYLERIELSFDVHSSPDQHIIEELTTALSSVKTLRKVFWRHFAEFRGRLDLPWNQLDVVYIEMDQPVANVISYMAQCSVASNITFREFSTRDAQADPHPEASSVSLPSLRVLELCAIPYQNSFWPLCCFSLPNLETLRIDAFSDLPEEYRFLVHFLNESECTLKQLKITQTCWPNIMAEIPKVFFDVPSLGSIPTVEIYSTPDSKIHGVMLQLLQARVPTQSLPRILAWTSYPGECAVGWKELAVLDTLKFSWNNGELDLCDAVGKSFF